MINDSTGEFAHFLAAQAEVYNRVVEELTAGKKRSHWMWFIFPQIKGLGSSPMAQKFALQSLAQARDYALHPVLGLRLRDCTRLVLEIKYRDVVDIFDFPDDLKFHSSMTLFALATPEEPLFNSVLTKYFQGQKDTKTLGILGLSTETPPTST